MARAPRTTKTVAQRIDLNYFKRSDRLQRWRSVLSLLVPLLGVIWLAGYGLAHNDHVYSSGPLAPAHAVLTQKCSSCHNLVGPTFSAKSSDQLCSTCHDGPIHHVNQNFTPACSSCHVEHRGLLRLAATADESCVRCHAQLQVHTTTGSTAYVHGILDFPRSHPEFVALRPGYSDPGTIKLNHAVHMKAGLDGPVGEVQLSCDDCHRGNATSQTWRFPLPSGSPPGETPKFIPVAAAGQKALPPSRSEAGAYMQPIVYAKHCAGCHPLPFDKRFAENVPHDTPEAVHAFVLKKLNEYIAAHPEQLRESVSTVMLPTKPIPVSPKVYSSPQQWVAAKAAEDEQLLWGKTCKQCHALDFRRAEAATGSLTSLPAVADSKILVRWFQHAVFSHDQHRLVNCESCHARALKSQETSDVLLPSIQTCRQCHHPGNDGAETRCFECHVYHDWKAAKDVKSKFTLADLLNSKFDQPNQPSTMQPGSK